MPVKFSMKLEETIVQINGFFQTKHIQESMAWKQFRCPSTNEWIKKLWNIYIYTHSGILLSHKRNACESVKLRWINLEPAAWSEISQKNKYHILTYIYGI